MIPPFNKDGNLPPGIHTAAWDEFCQRFGTNYYRRMHIQGMKPALDNLKTAGCKKVYINGGFVSSKHHPKDYDACWEEEGVDGDLLDPVFLDFSNKREAQKIKYSGEFFPASMISGPSGKRYIDFFQEDREGNKKGIIALDLEELT